MKNASIARSRRRSRERGAAVFIVVLVITMLTAIGLFAAHAATLSTIASGHARRMTQTHYLAEYAMQLALAEIEQRGGLNGGLATGENCLGAPDTCWTINSRELQQSAAEDLLELDAPGVPGSLGRKDVRWTFEVEMTDRIQPALGNHEGTSSTDQAQVDVEYCTVAMNGRLVAWPDPGNPVGEDEVVATAGSQEALSLVAHVLCR
ncbi:hypothetical protein BE08_16565 [Sorangium cellulosum]|uniref:Type 4 fimbrial biogenesis protein PilX N-terminal domain-containing protein n=1 Tax=Sorangium cellulosum TaxID=56 RepID=A0A150P6K0_SORCE|nr:hypothetical protein BE08_16565 [Sorangium cellulosum]